MGIHLICSSLLYLLFCNLQGSSSAPLTILDDMSVHNFDNQSLNSRKTFNESTQFTPIAELFSHSLGSSTNAAQNAHSIVEISSGGREMSEHPHVPIFQKFTLSIYMEEFSPKDSLRDLPQSETVESATSMREDSESWIHGEDVSPNKFSKESLSKMVVPKAAAPESIIQAEDSSDQSLSKDSPLSEMVVPKAAASESIIQAEDSSDQSFSKDSPLSEMVVPKAADSESMIQTEESSHHSFSKESPQSDGDSSSHNSSKDSPGKNEATQSEMEDSALPSLCRRWLHTAVPRNMSRLQETHLFGNSKAKNANLQFNEIDVDPGDAF